jgi:riboflavin kinase / FMN adenylyltransferase
VTSNKRQVLIIFGKVIRGDGYGKKLGFPTANIDRREYVRKKYNVKLGIWAGKVEIGTRGKEPAFVPMIIGTTKGMQEAREYKAAIVVGPKDKKGLPKLEAHLIGFKGNLYGKTISIQLQKYLRPFKKYSSELELVAQIKKDILLAKKIGSH